MGLYIHLSMFQQQQNNLYPKGSRFCENNFFKLMIGSQPMIKGRLLIYGGGINIA